MITFDRNVYFVLGDMNGVTKHQLGHPVPIVVTGDQHAFSLDEEALENILLQDHIQDRKVVVVSVAGAFRKGKSFLLDFCLRFMEKKVLAGFLHLWNWFSWLSFETRRTLLKQSFNKKRFCVWAVLEILDESAKFIWCTSMSSACSTCLWLVRCFCLSGCTRKSLTAFSRGGGPVTHSLYFQGSSDWMSDEHVKLDGFPWKGGSERYTTGILVWSEVFLIDLPSGEKVFHDKLHCCAFYTDILSLFFL